MGRIFSLMERSEKKLQDDLIIITSIISKPTLESLIEQKYCR